MIVVVVVDIVREQSHNFVRITERGRAKTATKKQKFGKFFLFPCRVVGVRC